MKNTTRFARPFVLALALTAMGVAHAQPPANNGAGAQNPPNQNPGGGGRPNFTPAQIQQMQEQMRQRRELELRSLLTAAGFTDTTVQDAIVAYSSAKEKASQALQVKARQLNQALRGTTVTDTQLAALLNDFRAAVEEEKARRATAQQALGTQIGLNTKPRLDALLMMSGLIGDEAQHLGGGRVFGGNGFGGGNARGGNGRGGNGRGGNAGAGGAGAAAPN